MSNFMSFLRGLFAGLPVDPSGKLLRKFILLIDISYESVLS